jgi:hypothetical protein
VQIVEYTRMKATTGIFKEAPMSARYGWVIILAVLWGFELFVSGLESVQIISSAW